jgi:hypothetical protein
MNDTPLSLNLAPRAGATAGFQPPLQSQVLRCSFCGLGEGEVARLFEGRAGYICNECVEVCVQVLADYRELGCKPPVIKVPWYKRLFGGEGGKAGHCSFCGAAQNEQEWLLASAETQICEKCVRECVKVCEVHQSNLAFG